MIKIKLGTRGSALALKQADMVKTALQQQGVSIEVVEIVSSGDKIQDKPLWDIGGKGLFCKELDTALLNGDIDIAVHSAKDIETDLITGTEIYAVLPRDDVRDVVISKYKLADLPSGAVIGTCSLRRQSQILAMRSDVVVKAIRGNVQTRLQKVATGKYDATFLAAAGLNRLNIDITNWEVLPVNQFVPSSAQGIVAIQGLSNNTEIKQIVQKINDKNTFLQLCYEREFLSGIAGDCKTPVGAYAEINENITTLHTFFGTADGSQIIKDTTVVKSLKQCYKLGNEIKQKYGFFVEK